MTAREKAWLFIRDKRQFTLEEMVTACEIKMDNGQRMLRQLVLNGYLSTKREGLKGSQGYVIRYTLINEPGGTCTPWARRAAERVPWQQEAWNAMRIRRRFTIPQLLISMPESVKYDLVYRWVLRLEERTLVTRVGRSRVNGANGSFIVYVLRDTSPFVPDLSFSRTKNDAQICP